MIASVPDATPIGCEGGFELLDPRSEHVRSVLEHLGDRGVELVSDGGHAPRELEERDLHASFQYASPASRKYASERSKPSRRPIRGSQPNSERALPKAPK